MSPTGRQGAAAALDSYALMAFLEREPGYAFVQDMLREAEVGVPLWMSLINWGEVYYATVRSKGQDAADDAVDVIDQLPIALAAPTRADVLEAARLKAKYPVSYADCFAAALARLHGCPVVTGDPDFRLLEKEVKVKWLPA